MKNYYDRDYKLIRSKSYLAWGLVMAALSLLMVVISVLTLEENSSIALSVTGFGAAVIWFAGAAACIRVYYRDNRIELKEKAKEIAETVENAVKK